MAPKVVTGREVEGWLEAVQMASNTVEVRERSAGGRVHCQVKMLGFGSWVKHLIKPINSFILLRYYFSL